jgi:hypothetical protein
MKLKSKWISATVAFVVVSMMTAMVEPAAFASSENEASQSEEHVADRAVAAPLPNRPVIMGTVAAALPRQTQTPTPATRATSPSSVPAKQQNTGKSKKWIIIAAAAGAGVAAGFLLAKGGDEPAPAPTITVGSPTVGGPQ